MSSILLDTNVVLRLAEPTSAEHSIVRAAIENLAARKTVLHLAPQVLFEFWVVATRPPAVNGFGWSPETTHTAVAQLRQRFPVLEDRPEIFDHWLNLVASKGIVGKRAHDARLVVTMQVHGIQRVLTLNVTDFQSLGAISVHPADCL